MVEFIGASDRRLICTGLITVGLISFILALLIDDSSFREGAICIGLFTTLIGSCTLAEDWSNERDSKKISDLEEFKATQGFTIFLQEFLTGKTSQAYWLQEKQLQRKTYEEYLDVLQEAQVIAEILPKTKITILQPDYKSALAKIENTFEVDLQPTATEVETAGIEWLDWFLSGRSVSHLMIIGTTGSGKTTLAQAILHYMKQQSIIVLDPKNYAVKWRVAVSYGQALDYRAINEAMLFILSEMQDRYQRLASGDNGFETLFVVLDEFPLLATNCPTAKDFFLTLTRVGREAKIRLIVLSQSERVATLRIVGEGDIRDNFLQIILGGKLSGEFEHITNHSTARVIFTPHNIDKIVSIKELSDSYGDTNK
jgi:hypothetical protein